MAENTLILVKECAGAFAEAGIRTWLFGGWAEELRGLCLPRQHKDIDLLYPAEDFSSVDRFIDEQELEEVLPKRFVHKRAFLWSDVLTEVFLLQPAPTGYITNFFGLYQFEWPANTMSDEVGHFAYPFPIASATALAFFRQKYEGVEGARRRYFASVSDGTDARVG